MANFTPGPWIFDPENVGCTPHAGYALYTPDFETGHEFCYVLCSVESERRLGVGVPQANANLIAAAPDMYAALKAVYEDLDGRYDGITKWMGDHLEAMEAALAKADGK